MDPTGNTEKHRETQLEAAIHRIHREPPRHITAVEPSMMVRTKTRAVRPCYHGFGGRKRPSTSME